MVAGEPIDLGAIAAGVCGVGRGRSHRPVAPDFPHHDYVMWPEALRAVGSGHILGIVNPPVKPPKRSYRVGPAPTDKPRTGTPLTKPSRAGWWDDWMAWLEPQSGDLVAARPVANDAFPALADAPGVLRKGP